MHDSLIDDERRHRPDSLLASLNMLIQTPGGSEYTAKDCTAWMREAGFSTVHVIESDHNAIGGDRIQRQFLATPSGVHVRFSNRPSGVKHFQTVHHCNVDVTHGLALLSEIGARALPSWDPVQQNAPCCAFSF